MTKKTIFFSVAQNLRLHIKPEKQVVGVNGMLDYIPAKTVRFVNGEYVTEDPEEIELIRKTEAYRRKRIGELTSDDKESVAIAQEVIEEVERRRTEKKGKRGAIDTNTLKGKPSITVAEKNLKAKTVTKCDICGKEFENDLTGRKLRTHKQWHRRQAKLTQEKKG